MAQGNLSERIRVTIIDSSQYRLSSVHNLGNYHETEVFNKDVTITANADLVGINIESYFDKKGQIVYVFAYANKRELANYYMVTLAADIRQLENTLATAKQLEQDDETAQARKHYRTGKDLVAKIATAQDLLLAIDPHSTGETLQQTRLPALRHELTQALARLAQSVFIDDHEEIAGHPCSLVADKLKALLAVAGYSFTDNAAQAGLRLTLHAVAHNAPAAEPAAAIVFCYADVTVELHDQSTHTTVYKNTFSGKGGSTSYERAAAEAFNTLTPDIAQTIIPYMN
jgi:hypothetical protein